MRTYLKTFVVWTVVVAATAIMSTGYMAAAEESEAFDSAKGSVKAQLEQSIAELNAVREQVAAEKIPLSRELSELEAQLSEVRREYQQTTRLLDSRTLDLSNLRNEIESRKEESNYLSNLLGEYMRNFESRLHIAELQRYRDALTEAKLAMENSNLSQSKIFAAQAELLDEALARLEDALGGDVFTGTAVDPSGLLKSGSFALVGPAALFVSEDGSIVGTAEQRLGSLEPTVVAFGQEEDTAAAQMLVKDGLGKFPLDPTLGNAHKVEQTRETFLEHVQKGGPVMYPIFGLAGAALLVAIYKMLAFLLLRMPSQKRIEALLAKMADGPGANLKAEVKLLNKPDLRLIPSIVRWLVVGVVVCLSLWVVSTLAPDLSQTLIPGAFGQVVGTIMLAAVVCGVVWGLLVYVGQAAFGHSPVGKMLSAGVDHLGEPRELIEEVMFERVLSTKLKLQRLLPFVAISAASAPLLGLLGTVTGIINTFKLITIFGSGDVKTLSGGISEALITTEFGLIVAIPSLLLHAFLSRKASSIINEMERVAVSFVNQISKTIRDEPALTGTED